MIMEPTETISGVFILGRSKPNRTSTRISTDDTEVATTCSVLEEIPTAFAWL